MSEILCSSKLDDHVIFNTNLIIELNFRASQRTNLEKHDKVLGRNFAMKSHIRMRLHNQKGKENYLNYIT